MSGYVEANGISQWYDERGTGDPVLLLHGGLSDSRDFEPSLAALADRFHLYLPDRRGHGHTPDVDGPITVELMAADAAAFLEQVAGGRAHVVGYSAGAAVALRLAMVRPDLVDRLVLISGAFSQDGMIFGPSAEGEPPAELVARYAEVSPHGAEHFPVVIGKVARAFQEDLPWTPADLKAVTARTLVLSGDDDLVTLEHTIELYRALPDGQLAIVPETTHLLLFEKPELCTALVRDFLTLPPTPTLMPIRRAAQQRP